MAGVKVIERTINLVLDDEVRQKARGLMLGMAESVADVARDLVPVDTGGLRASIEANWEEEDGGDKLVATVQTGEGADNKNYGRYVEEGTSTHAAQPFLQPAFDAVEPFEDFVKKLNRDGSFLNADAIVSFEGEE